ncbi:selection and upkeep of intraepithelial T-cells protein 7-like isoform X2 [Tachypleus tridentatus]|uniref:selection and upkeep of intraepithelial T-cells protein 7-like isoform X2 n=1 Tax=Tachypleus tridentatus TaxID=6853 RepID=UPI003FD15D4A
MNCFIRYRPPFFFLWAVLYLHIVNVAAVKIRRLSVPRWVENGTERPITLDCEYLYTHNDLHLVVKWFYNNEVKPVYQWIPALSTRYVSGFLQGRLDDTFVAEPLDTYSRYRALRIIKPTIDMTGTYTCVVTSLANQDSREQGMVVYAPAKTIVVNHSLTSSNELDVSCTAKGLFPRPQIELFVSKPGKTVPLSVGGASVSTFSREGVFDIELKKTFSIRNLSKTEATIFECFIEIPGTDYVTVKRNVYFPEPVKMEQGDRSGISHGKRVIQFSDYIFIVIILMVLNL